MRKELGLDDVQPIKIRVRQVLSGAGETSQVQTVCCPRHGASVSVDSCTLCGHSQGRYEGPGDARVLCDDEHARDVTLRQISGSHIAHSRPTPVRELMTTHVFCVRPDVSIDQLIALLIDRDVNGVPVVDERGAPVGFISKTDLVRQRYEDGDTAPLDCVCEPGFQASSLAQVTVADLMALVPVTFSEQAPIAQVTEAMVSEHVHQLPIVGVDGTVVGIVSSLDLVRWYVGREGQRSCDYRRAEFGSDS